MNSNLKKTFKTICFCLVWSISFTQDFHLSQYWAVSQKLNPALTGLFNNNIQVAAIYRNQWVQNNSFSNYAISLEANLLRKKIKTDFIGVGLLFNQENLNLGDFKNNNVNFSFAYFKKIQNRKNIQHLSFGMNISYFERQVNMRNLIYGNYFEKNINFDPIDLKNYQSNIFMDLGLGVNYLLHYKNKELLSFGFSIKNILEQNKDLGKYKEAILYRNYTAHFNSEIKLIKNYYLITLLLFQQQGSHSEIVIGTYTKLNQSKKNNTNFYLGVQYRMASNYKNKMGSDAVIIGLRTEYRNFDIGLSYDFTISEISKEHTISTPEIYLMYSVALKKGNQMLCPKF